MLVTELMAKGSRDGYLQWLPILETYFSKLDPKDYTRLFLDIYVSLFGEKLNVDLAEYLVSKMLPYGQKWTSDEVAKLLKNGETDISTNYYVMNMMFNDYYDLFKDNVEQYVAISKLWLNDIDSMGGDVKTFRYATLFVDIQ